VPKYSRQPQVLANGRYALTARLGEGGMAGVYRAFDEQMQDERAVKVMLPQAARSKKLRLRFEKEAHTLARLSHPNLVRIYDVQTQRGVPFLVMELITGGTLNDWVERNGPMPPRLATSAIIQLCEGVIAAHAAFVVHRDIKPHNVLVSPSGLCKLADFGIAHVDEDGLTRTGSTMGTMGYMPPEQRKDAKSVDARCDVFSIAASLWFLLKDEAVVDLFLAADRPEILDGIPDVLKPVLTTALQYNRDDRYDDATQLRDALQAALKELPPDPPCPELAAPQPTLPELEADWFEELAPIFDEDFNATPEPADLRPPKALPYYMPPSHPSSPPARRSSPPAPARSTKQSDTLPDYIDREALSQEGRADPLPPMPEPEPEAEAETGSYTVPLLAGGGLTIAAGAAAVVALVALVSFLYTGVALQRTASDVAETEAELYGLLDNETALINDLVSLGAPRAFLDAPYFAYQDAEDAEARDAAAQELVDALDKASSELDGTQGTRADTVRAQVRRIVRIRDDHLTAEADRAHYRSTLRGRLLTTVGVGD